MSNTSKASLADRIAAAEETNQKLSIEVDRLHGSTAELAAIGAGLRLADRLRDMAAGQMGNAGPPLDGVPDEFLGMCSEMGTEEWLAWISAIKAEWVASNGRDPEDGKALPRCFELWALHHFDAAYAETAAFLYEAGARP